MSGQPNLHSLNGKKILLGVTGSIAAYKSAFLVRRLQQSGAELRVVMTPAAKDFITPLTLSTLSKHRVLIDLFHEDAWENHVMLGRWADLMLIAPLSCNTLSKMATGACDNLLMATYLSATCPVFAAPAMDEDMWIHPATQLNLEKIGSYGVHLIPVGTGELASGLHGAGRMAEPEEIVAEVEHFFSDAGQLKGKQVLVSAGPTYEAIDPVRFVGNHSSGKMGVELAQAFRSKGARVSLVLGPVGNQLDMAGLNVRRVTSAEDMYHACTELFSNADITVMAAAVADYTPAIKAEQKIKKKEEQWQLQFTRTRDILKSLGELKRPDQILVGFALETTNEKENALSKLRSKNADMIVLNSLNDEGAGFGFDTNKITIFDREGSETAFPVKTKKEAAHDIVDFIVSRSISQS